jgi:hypothetical protein
MMAKEKSGWVRTCMAILRIGWNGERRNKAFSAENRNIVPPLEMTMNVFLSRK